MGRRWIGAVTCIAMLALHGPLPAAAQAVPDEPAAASAPAAADAQAIDGGSDLAADDAVIERWDWAKFWGYTACGAAIILATGGAGVVAMVIACGRVLSLYWTT